MFCNVQTLSSRLFQPVVTGLAEIAFPYPESPGFSARWFRNFNSFSIFGNFPRKWPYHSLRAPQFW